MMRCVLLTLAIAAAVLASSHSEAPGSQKNLKADLTDFYMFRSYDPTANPNSVTFIMNVSPLQAPFGGPNYAAWSSEHYYEINVDNDYDGVEDIIFQFAYNSKLGQRPNNQQVTIQTYSCPNPDQPTSSSVPGGIAIDVAGDGTTVPVPLKFVGPVTFADQSALNYFEWVNMNVLNGRGGSSSQAVLAGTSNKNFNKPFDYAGVKTFGTASDYHAYSSSFVHDITFPAPSAAVATGTCAARLFTGARRESFSVALGRIFDLINLDPINVQDCVYRNDLANFNIGSFVLEVPTNCLVASANSADAVIAAWLTVREKTISGTALRQVSRLGHPLINEVVIGLTDKDLFNRVDPTQDALLFGLYVFYPTLPALINALFTVPAPDNFPRGDLVTAFLSGVPGVNQGSASAPYYEALRLNTGLPATPYANQKNYGIVTPTTSLSDADLAGFPNGRRPGDDVVDIALRVMMGRLCHPPFNGTTFGFNCQPSNAPVGTVPLTDGAPQNAQQFLPIFPYLPIPLPGAYNDATYNSCTQSCGDGKQQTPEQCDDGNNNDNDGCSSGCMVEVGYDCATPGVLCDGICGDGLVRGTEECDTGLDTSTPCCRNCKALAACTCDNSEPTQCTPPVSSTIGTSMSSTSSSTTTSTSTSSSTSGGTPATPSASRAPTSSSATSLTGGIVVSGCFSTLPPNDNENAICQKVRQERVKDGEYCGWCEEGPMKDGSFEFVWRYCEDGSPCAPDAGGVPLCNPVTYVGIGEACDTANRVVCRDGYYDVACVDGICGCVNCVQPGGECSVNGKNKKGEDIFGVNSGCQFGSCLPNGAPTDAANPTGTCSITPDGQPCGSAPYQCAPNEYCATEQNGAFCRPRLAVGADCSKDPTGCPWTAQCFDDVCVAYGSRGVGEKCVDHRMCASGLGCNLEATPAPVCFSPDSQGQGCNFPDQTGDECPDGYICLCNYATGGGECYTPVSGRATQLFADALACIDAAQCTTDLSLDKPGITFFPDQCLDDNCRSEIIAYYKAAGEESFDNGLKSADLLKGSAASLSAFVALIVLAVAAAL